MVEHLDVSGVSPYDTTALTPGTSQSLWCTRDYSAQCIDLSSRACNCTYHWAIAVYRTLYRVNCYPYLFHNLFEHYE